MTMKRKIRVTRGSGNVFADLGFDNPEEELLKADLVREIRAIVHKQKFTQEEAAQLLGIRQPDVSALLSGRVDRFSFQRLLMFLPRLGRDVNIVVSAKPRSRPARMKLALPAA
jgi:predicted XRE-type DNA-binding protein